MPKKTERKVCGAVYFGFEVLRCQLPAGHVGMHYGRGWGWGRESGDYQAQVRKAAELKASVLDVDPLPK